MTSVARRQDHDSGDYSDASHPEIEHDRSGNVSFAGERVAIELRTFVLALKVSRYFLPRSRVGMSISFSSIEVTIGDHSLKGG